jgi:hypothetical protein
MEADLENYKQLIDSQSRAAWTLKILPFLLREDDLDAATNVMIEGDKQWPRDESKIGKVHG